MADESKSLTPEQIEQLRSMGGVQTLADIPKLLRLFFYGDPKLGKTDLVAKICQELNLDPIWVYSDSGFSTVLKYPDLAKRTWAVPFDSFGHIRLMVQAHDEGLEPFCNYNAIVLDTVSTQIDTMLRVSVKNHPLKEQPHPGVEGWGHYRMVEAGMKDTVAVLTKSNLHVFYTAHIREPTKDDKEKKGRFAIRPAGPEATYRKVAQEANLIAWLYRENGQRFLQTDGTLQVTAGSQIPTVENKVYKVEQIPSLLAKYVNS